jgi:outer membrane protein OmpA-like peptidoglycan-associated protein
MNDNNCRKCCPDKSNRNIDANRPYWRKEIDREFDKAKKQLHELAVERGNGNALHNDVNTGKELHGGDKGDKKYEYDHIYDAKNLFNELKAEFTNDEIAEIVNVLENVKPTLKSINRSKLNRDTNEFIQDENFVAKHNIDVERAKKAAKEARNAIEAKKNEIRDRIKKEKCVCKCEKPDFIKPSVDILGKTANPNVGSFALNIPFKKEAIILLLLLLLLYLFSFIKCSGDTFSSAAAAAASVPVKQEKVKTAVLNTKKDSIQNTTVDLPESYFRFNKSVLNSKYAKELHVKIDSLIINNPDYTVIEIKGYTCDLGPEEYNLNLSERRALSIKKMLISKGIPKEKIKSEGQGEKTCNADSEINACRIKNRKAQISIR